jgi:hypothetical protein
MSLSVTVHCVNATTFRMAFEFELFITENGLKDGEVKSVLKESQ